MNDRQRLESIVSVVCKYLPPDGIGIEQAMNEIISLVDPLPPQPKEPEQEPVAWQAEVLIQGVWSPVGNPQRDKSRAERLATIPSIPKECQRVIDFYTTPPQRTWVGLTDDETAELVHRYAFYELTRQIEAKLKEKNA